jgi:hypothetical protein
MNNCYSCTTKDIRDVLEGYCLDMQFQTVGTITTVADSAEATLSMDLAIKPHARIESPIEAEILVKNGRTLTFDKPFTESETCDVAFIQYKSISDDWLSNTRDYQIIPIVKRTTGISFSGMQRITEYHSGTGSSILILNRRPIVEVHAINLITNPENWVYVSPGSVDPIAEEGILKLKVLLESWQNYVPAFPRGTDNIKVDYTYGYDGIPCDICRAVNMLVASHALAQIGARSGGGSLSVQGYSKNYGSRGKYTDYRNELERYAHAILRRYVMGLIGG